MHDGSLALALLNRGEATASVGVTWSQLGLPAGRSCWVRDLLTQKSVGTRTSYSASLGAHEAAAVRISC